MEYIYAALLLHKLGQKVDEHNLKKVISATGAQVDEGKIKLLVATLKDVDIDKELESAVAFTATPASAVPAKAPEAKEDKKEEKASEAAEGLSSLFG
ncbi:50S ribosomal protein P1 [Candidatus Pacearchaeota archaeon]|nr:50S ribosomal protein P1 [Candidatus Pacearchaeota archaeon]